MVKNLLLPLAGVAAFIVIVGLLTQGKIKIANPSPSPSSKVNILVSGVKVLAEIADSAEEREKGLSGRNSLPENEGMLFVFDSKDVTPSFWMKGMKIPLDIIWIDNGKIVKIDKNVPFSDQKRLYTPSKPIDYVLEVNAGFSDKNNLKIGDLVEGDPIKN